jgi:hypothetical protein
MAVVSGTISGENSITSLTWKVNQNFLLLLRLVVVIVAAAAALVVGF